MLAHPRDAGTMHEVCQVGSREGLTEGTLALGEGLHGEAQEGNHSQPTCKHTSAQQVLARPIASSTLQLVSNTTNGYTSFAAREGADGQHEQAQHATCAHM